MPNLVRTLRNGARLYLGNGEITIRISDLEVLTAAELIAEVRVLADDFEELKHLFGGGELAGIETIEAAKSFAAGLQQTAHECEIKKKHTKKRRHQFNAKRSQLLLALIERDGYICKQPGCGAFQSLTVDHIIPISRGGTDELTNLQLLCQPHNSLKGTDL